MIPVHRSRRSNSVLPEQLKALVDPLKQAGFRPRKPRRSTPPWPMDTSQTDPHPFGWSPTYVERACRGEFLLVEGGGLPSPVAVGFRDTPKARYFAIVAQGQIEPEPTARLAHAIVAATDLSFILKDIARGETEDRLRAMGFEPYRKDDAWCAAAPLDDQTYPQLVVDTEVVAEAKGPSFSALRQRLSIVSRRLSPVFTDYDAFGRQDPSNRGKVQELLLEWADWFTQRYPAESPGGLVAYYKPFLDPNGVLRRWSRSSGRKVLARVGRVRERVVAYAYAEQASSAQLDLYASFCAPNYDNLIYAAIHDLCIQAAKKRFRYLNLGGSEYEGHDFVRRLFRPVESFSRTHVVLYPGRMGSPSLPA